MRDGKSDGPIRLGLCGIGRTGFGRIRLELAGRLGGEFELVAGFDVIHERAEQLRELFGAAAYGRFEDLLADPRVEVVVIATRSDTHAELATQALRAGKHVVVEKPMAVDLAQTDQLLAEAARARGNLFVRFNRRFDPAFLAARGAVDQGLVGRVHSVQIRVGEYVRRHDWQTLRKFGGGQLLNWGPHVIDWALELLGGQAKEVWADTRRVAAAGDAEDHVKLVIRGANSAVADIEVSGGNAARQPMFVVQGDRGAVIADVDRVQLRYLKQSFQPPRLDVFEGTPPQDDRGYKASQDLEWVTSEEVLGAAQGGAYWGAVHAALREGAVFPVSLERAREVMRVIEVARCSGSWKKEGEPSR